MDTSKAKVVGVETEAKRAMAMQSGAYGFGVFIMLLGIPLLNLIIGFVVLASIAMPIFRKSNQMGTDLFWLLIGTVVCFAGMLAYPVLPMLNYSSTGSAIVIGAVLRAVAYWGIVQTKLRHI